MTVLELYRKLEDLLEDGYEDYPVVINQNPNSLDGEIPPEANEVNVLKYSKLIEICT